jgi:dTDP-4-dehydrorhamnose reductase
VKILLLGKNGQVGWELQRSLAPLGTLVALDRHSKDHCGDLFELAELAQTVRKLRPDVIVNAAAYTAVDQAETESELAHVLNALAPQVLAVEAAKIGALLVHYSTDYVFDGSGDMPWTEYDSTGPVNVYGATKLDGEKRISHHCPRHLILRTSWVYAARGGNFAKTMLRLAQERDKLSVINDQFGAPTGADLIADVTAHAITQLLQAGAQQNTRVGTYHLVASGTTTWYDYAKHVLSQAQALQPTREFKAKEIKAVHSSAFPTPARRPKNSRLDTSKLQANFGLTLPPWQQGVDRMLAEIQT